MSLYKVQAIPAFNDNYIWCIHNNQNALVVDPGDAVATQTYLSEHQLSLTAILLTHHHPDHTGGVAKLKDAYPECQRIGFSEARYDKLDRFLNDGDVFTLDGLDFTVLAVPGHTLDHIAFYTESSETPWLFSGDTLFSGGCGRLFEGSPEQMYDSLSRLRDLPGNTLVFCAHEYTLSNLAFAKHLMPENQDLNSYIHECEALRKSDRATIPTRISTELEINPFLRSFDPELIANLAQMDYKDLVSPVDVFAATRHAKDNF
jgi:hydroxyacylglutathione hydrolase